MATFREKLERTEDFLLGAELVSTRGTITEVRAARTVAFARDLAASPRVDWVSITDNAGGNPMLAPAALGAPIHDAGRDVAIHLSCKDYNRNGLESVAWHLASEGFHNLLALSGDSSGTGIAGGAKPVFDIDSVGLLELIGQMNAGLDVTRAGSRRAMRLAPTRFFPGCVVTNFKRHENEVVPQLLKLEKKLASGARWIVNQIGYDARKMSELIVWLRTRGHGSVPLIGNVYVLNPGVARLFLAQQIPGVVVTERLAAVCERHESSPDKGRAFFHELAAKQIAIYRGLGYRGAYLGGVHTAEEYHRVLELADGFASNDWKQFLPDLDFSQPGEYYCFAATEDRLADPARPTPRSPASLGAARRFTYQFSKFAHHVMFTPGKGLWKVGARWTSEAADPHQGPGWMRAIEHHSKTALFGCKDCGDCSLPEIAFLCPESSCAKNQRNGPCGGTREGLCEVGDFPCIWARAYDRLKSEGREQDLLAHAPVIQDQSLRGTSSWANTWQGRDHLSRPQGSFPEVTPPSPPALSRAP